MNATNPGPIQLDPNEYRWFTDINSRTPKVKRHRLIGHAKSALANAYGTNNKGYELRDGEWVDVSKEWKEQQKARQEKDRLKREEYYDKVAPKCPTCGQRTSS